MERGHSQRHVWFFQQTVGFVWKFILSFMLHCHNVTSTLTYHCSMQRSATVHFTASSIYLYFASLSLKYKTWIRISTKDCTKQTPNEDSHRYRSPRFHGQLRLCFICLPQLEFTRSPQTAWTKSRHFPVSSVQRSRVCVWLLIKSQCSNYILNS